MVKLGEKIKKYGVSESFKIGFYILCMPFRNLYRTIRIVKARLLSQDCFIVKEVQGSKMLLDLRDAGISQELFLKGIHEAESTRQLKEELKPGMTIIEVGANIGYYALMEASIVGKDGKIIAFEPSPVNMLTLQTNIMLNGFEDRIETYQMGIGGENGRMKFHLMNKGNMSSFYSRKDGGGVKTLEETEVDVTTIDNFLKDKSIQINYLRMDIEGFEYEVISGMKRLLGQANGPEGFFMELHSKLLNENGRSCEQLLELLDSFGYQISIARWRGKSSYVVRSNRELLGHKLCEDGYWEAFFKKQIR